MHPEQRINNLHGLLNRVQNEAQDAGPELSALKADLEQLRTHLRVAEAAAKTNLAAAQEAQAKVRELESLLAGPPKPITMETPPYQGWVAVRHDWYQILTADAASAQELRKQLAAAQTELASTKFARDPDVVNVDPDCGRREGFTVTVKYRSVSLHLARELSEFFGSK